MDRHMAANEAEKNKKCYRIFFWNFWMPGEIRKAFFLLCFPLKRKLDEHLTA